MAKFDKRLAAILAKHNLLTAEQHDAALAQAGAGGAGLAQHLVENRLVDELTIVACVAEEMNLAPIDLAKVEVDREALDLISEDLANYYDVMPISRLGNSLTVAVSNPADILTLDDIKIITGCEIQPVVSTTPSIRKAIQKHYNVAESEMEQIVGLADAGAELEFTTAQEDEGGTDLSALAAESEEAPVVKLVNLIIHQALTIGASDIHVEPFEKRLRIRYRVDGDCHDAISPPKRMQSAICSRIKIMSSLDISEKRKPQDGKFQLKYQGRQIDFRVSVLPVIHGEKVVMRILDTGNLARNLDTLGFEQKALDDFRGAIGKPYGMVLVTGPTGSGKSTTLYSAVKEVLCPEENIVTVEDPVEYQVDGVNQVPVNEKAGVSFASALRSILRQDPDTIMIGEIRDQETLQIAIRAALTGHLVFSTLHTNDAPSTVTRMMDMGADAFMVASSTLLVSAQRLVRRLCDECKRPQEVPVEQLVKYGLSEQEAAEAHLFEPVGCSRCGGGYKGRFALLETMPVTEQIQRLIVDKRSALEIKGAALREGMVTLRRCGLLNALRGKTSLREVIYGTMADD